MSDGFLSPQAASAVAFGGGGYLLHSRTKYKTWGIVFMVLGGLSALGAITKSPEVRVSGKKRDLLVEGHRRGIQA